MLSTEDRICVSREDRPPHRGRANSGFLGFQSEDDRLVASTSSPAASLEM